MVIPALLPPVKVNVPRPVLVRVMVCDALVLSINTEPKDSDFGDSDTTGKPVPVPLRATVCGLVGSPSTIVTVPLIVPTDSGVKVKVTVHFFPAFSVAPQVLLLMA